MLYMLDARTQKVLRMLMSHENLIVIIKHAWLFAYTVVGLTPQHVRWAYAGVGKFMCTSTCVYLNLNCINFALCFKLTTNFYSSMSY